MLCYGYLYIHNVSNLVDFEVCGYVLRSCRTKLCKVIVYVPWMDVTPTNTKPKVPNRPFFERKQMFDIVLEVKTVRITYARITSTTC